VTPPGGPGDGRPVTPPARARATLARARRGVAAVEFALVLPILALLLAATADIALHLRTTFRIERTAAELANLVSQHESLASADLTRLFEAAEAISGPSLTVANPGGQGGRTVISLVAGANTEVSCPAANCILWQRSRGNAARFPESRIGAERATAALPGGFIVPPAQTVVVAEVFYPRSAWFFADAFFGSGPQSIHASAVVRPRAAQLSGIRP
jgi:Flp pilus assembly pilin Flp